MTSSVSPDVAGCGCPDPRFCSRCMGGPVSPDVAAVLGDRPMTTREKDVAAVLAEVAEAHRFSAHEGNCDCGEVFMFGDGHSAHLAALQATALTAATHSEGIEESVRELTDYGPEGCI